MNAAFNMELEPGSSTVQGKPSFVYGGIDAHAVGILIAACFVLACVLLPAICWMWSDYCAYLTNRSLPVQLRLTWRVKSLKTHTL